MNPEMIQELLKKMRGAGGQMGAIPGASPMDARTTTELPAGWDSVRLRDPGMPTGGAPGKWFGRPGQSIPPQIARMLQMRGRMRQPPQQGPMPGAKPGNFGTRSPANSFSQMKPVMGRPARKPPGPMTRGTVGQALGR